MKSIKKIRLLFLLSSIIPLSLSVTGQYQYEIMLYKGIGKIQESTNTDWKDIQVKQMYTPKSNTAKLLLEKESVLIVKMGNSYKMLSKAGIYHLAAFSFDTPSNLNDCLNFVWKNLFNKKERLEDNGTKYLNAEGIVIRSDTCSIKLKMPLDNSSILNIPVEFSWVGNLQDNSKYYFKVYELKGTLTNQLYSQVIQGTSVKIDPMAIKLQPNKEYYWSVSASEITSCTNYRFRIISENSLSSLLANSAELIAYDDHTKLLTLSLYITNNLKMEALRTIRAIEIEKGNNNALTDLFENILYEMEFTH